MKGVVKIPPITNIAHKLRLETSQPSEGCPKGLRPLATPTPLHAGITSPPESSVLLEYEYVIHRVDMEE